MEFLSAEDLGGPVALDGDLVIEGDDAAVLPHLPSDTFDVIYIDPPFNRGKPQRADRIKVTRDAEGPRRGYGGAAYTSELITSMAYADPRHADYLEWLTPKLEEARRVLAPHGTLYFHIDYREAHYCKVLLDQIFGRDCFLNEIIWIYDYGGRPKNRWPAKHDTILVYVKDRKQYHFDDDEVDREPYMAPGLVGPEKAARGKRATDSWWHTIVPTSGSERTGYPTQKPEGIVRRMVAASSRPDGWCLDFFAGSGTLGAVARGLGRRFVLVDDNPEAIEVMKRRLGAPRPQVGAWPGRYPVMDLAYQPDRPALKEVFMVLVACALILFGLVKLDPLRRTPPPTGRADTLAEQAKASKARPKKLAPVAHRPRRRPRSANAARSRSRSARPGAAAPPPRSPINYERAPGASGELLRTVRPEPSSTPAIPQSPPMLLANIDGMESVAAAPRQPTDPGPPASLLALFAGCGIIMSLAGTALLIRIPR